MNSLFEWIDTLLASSNIDYGSIPYLRLLMLFVGLIIISMICFYITKYAIIHTLYKFIRRTSIKWDDLLVEYKTFDNVAHLIPAIIVKQTTPLILMDFEKLIPFITKLTDIYIIIAILIIVLSFLKASEHIIRKSPIFINKPITSYFQLIRIILYIIIAILIISIFIEQSPLYLLSAFGAMSAILLLIFKDTILGLVASVQISSNDMVRPGDWIEMPKFNANGEVLTINLNTVKVENWDKTITTIPTYFFISDSFKNWRGMQQSGGRRINRAIHINTRSVKFIDVTLKKRLTKVQLIHDYLLDREKEINAYNEEHCINTSELINGRRMTNVGVFRQYIEYYLRNHPHIRKDMTLMVRQLDFTERGLPIELYCFTATTEWLKYEQIQADIFDHLLAATRFFDLEIFQPPSGEDIHKAMTTIVKNK
ncbi:MAG: mechanosensitive ion channel [Bacteroidales bacterium]|jgi:miniconductance mechanosensitive channel|nr:mechanosensitive ion channel [Bacteroidales bacterium]